MRPRTREKIRFQRKAGRPALSHEEVEYWTDLLGKILKIGTEFEINLPSPREALDSPEELPCIHSLKSCATDCANLDDCLVDRHPTLCSTRETGRFLDNVFVCPAKNSSDINACKTCPGWLLNCRSLECSMYTPVCGTCPSFQREGNPIENSDIRRDAEAVREEMRQLLSPSEFVGSVGKHGVLQVTKDNSLLHNGGIEVPTVGRRVHWSSFYRMCQNIIDPIVERGGFVNERCGQHFHVLAGYLDSNTTRVGKTVSELEVPMPEIILANLHQLHRRYELAMFWIMSSGATMNHLTRWARFRQSLRRFSALGSRMQRVQAEMGEAIVGMNSASALRGKYASVAYHFCRFDGGGDVSTFHIENRIADGVLSPAVATAWAMLCYALVLKAVRISQYGIMEDGTTEYRTKVKEIQPHLIDGELREWGNKRFANTSGLDPHTPWLRENARELIQWLKPELSNLGPAFEILLSLADRPCSIRLTEGDSWSEIEAAMHVPERVEQSQMQDDLREVIDLATIMDIEDVEAWVQEVAGYLGHEIEDVSEAVRGMISSGEFRWSEPIGALITA